MSKYLPFLIVTVVAGWIFWSMSEKSPKQALTYNDDSGTIKTTPTTMNNNSLTSQDNATTASQSEVLGEKKAYSQVPELFLNDNQDYFVTLDTSLGEIKIKLFQDEVPVAANNFAFLAKDGFYNGTIFHRVIKNFMIQGGDPTGTGTGGPGYKFNDEEVTREYDRGIIAYANSGPDTNGSQFFIIHQDYVLPKNYVIFGEVVDGMDTVDKIANSPVEKSAYGELSVPKEEVIINSATLGEE